MGLEVLLKHLVLLLALGRGRHGQGGVVAVVGEAQLALTVVEVGDSTHDGRDERGLLVLVAVPVRHGLAAVLAGVEVGQLEGVGVLGPL